MKHAIQNHEYDRETGFRLLADLQPRGRATATGKSARHHITGERAPVYRLSEPPACSGWYADGDVVELPDGDYAYVFDCCGEAGLYRHAVAIDAGDNEQLRRAAPSTTAGIARDGSTVVGDKLLGWVA